MSRKFANSICRVYAGLCAFGMLLACVLVLTGGLQFRRETDRIRRRSEKQVRSCGLRTSKHGMNRFACGGFRTARATPVSGIDSWNSCQAAGPELTHAASDGPAHRKSHVRAIRKSGFCRRDRQSRRRRRMTKAMSNKALKGRFHRLLELKTEQIMVHKQNKEDEAACIVAGKIAGIADAMTYLGLIDHDEARYITDGAWALANGKEFSDEA